MKKDAFSLFIRTKKLGILVIIAGVVSFFQHHQKKGIYDFNELAVGLSWGLVFIFFSKERNG
jgi:hypothetical protein